MSDEIRADGDAVEPTSPDGPHPEPATADEVKPDGGLKTANPADPSEIGPAGNDRATFPDQPVPSDTTPNADDEESNRIRESAPVADTDRAPVTNNPAARQGEDLPDAPPPAGDNAAPAPAV